MNSETTTIPITDLEHAPVGTYLIFGDPWENSVWVKETPDYWTTLGKWPEESFTNQQLATVQVTHGTPWIFS